MYIRCYKVNPLRIRPKALVVQPTARAKTVARMKSFRLRAIFTKTISPSSRWKFVLPRGSLVIKHAYMIT